jgi:eukaryotic-like serine/threonine-protein kinase
LLFAAPMVAALTLLASSLNEFDLTRSPESAAFLFGTSLLATWGVLIPSKLLEGRANTFMKRIAFVGAAALVGLGSWALAGALDVLPLFTHPRSAGIPFEPPVAAGYFAGLSLIGGWWALSPRDRKARFRLWPLVRTGAAGALLVPIVAVPPAYGISAALITAIAAQAVSPWNKQAATYTRYVARAGRRGKKANVA